MTTPATIPVIADGPLAPAVLELLQRQTQVAPIVIVPWNELSSTARSDILGVYTYGHPTVDDAMLAKLPNVKVISNYGVGVDHIHLPAASRRRIPVGNTPGILDGATADMAFALLLAAGRRVVEGDHYARSPQFTSYDPGYMLGREVHSSTIGIVGLGRIGGQIARRAKGFDMRILYHNRNRHPEAEATLGAEYRSLDELLAESDYVVLSVPLGEATRGLIGKAQLARMRPTAILINVARGPVVQTEALTEALRTKQIYAAALDVTDPEPLPRSHPLLQLSNVTITPHLGSGTDQTRQLMAEISVENLLLGLQGKPLRHSVSA